MSSKNLSFNSLLKRLRKSLLRQVSQAADFASSAALRNGAFACSFAQSFDCVFISQLSFAHIFLGNCLESLLENGTGNAADDRVAVLAFLSLQSALG